MFLESHHVIAEHPQVAAELKAELAAQIEAGRARMGGPRRRRGPSWQWACRASATRSG